MNEKERKKLQKIWYQKLKDDGFEDLEYFDKKTMEPELWLKGNSRTRNVDVTEMANVIAGIAQTDTCNHFLDAAHLLLEDVFDNGVDKHIWMLYSEGKSIRQVMSQVDLPFSQVRKRINKYKGILTSRTPDNQTDIIEPK